MNNMAQQNFTISPPHAFWASGAELAMKWVEWKGYFVNYINAVDEAGKMKAEQMKWILFHALGPVGFKTYTRMPKAVTSGDSNVFEGAVKDLISYFVPKVCICIVHYKFFQRKQNKGETADEYVAQLKKLAIDCKFGYLHDNLIRDQLVMHSNNTAIQERLWVNSSAPLEDVLAIVCKA